MEPKAWIIFPATNIDHINQLYDTLPMDIFAVDERYAQSASKYCGN